MKQPIEQDKPRASADFPIDEVRTQFPALEKANGFIFFDNGAGAQVPQVVLDAMTRHLTDHNVQRGGRYARSKAVDEAIGRGRSAICEFVNARRPEEIAFGMNATSFIRLVSLAIGQTLSERNEIVVTDLDHEANIATWLALEGQGATFRWWKVREDGNLYMDDLDALVTSRTRIVACTLASNAVGSIIDVRACANLVHRAGAELFVDAVHFGPHGRIDVRDLDCDYLVCSGYKIFGPHMGFMWGRYELLKELPTFREDFIPNEPPEKIEAGTIIFENVAGMTAAVEYLGDLGSSLINRRTISDESDVPLTVAMQAIRAYEQCLSTELLHVLKECEAVVYGICDPAKVSFRVPTVCFNLERIVPSAVTEYMAEADIGIRDGHLYSPRLMRSLALDPETGAVRVSLVHYNTVAEIHQFGNRLLDLKRKQRQ